MLKGDWGGGKGGCANLKYVCKLGENNIEHLVYRTIDKVYRNLTILVILKIWTEIDLTLYYDAVENKIL